jgi:2-methylcitrate dehydratase PrpD
MRVEHYEWVLAEFVSQLRPAEVPTLVQDRAENLFLDWIGSALAGKGSRPAEAMARFAARMGPGKGRCEILINRTRSTPFFASMVNAAASHVVEQDDIHNGSVFHPATVVFPVALAVAQDLEASGADFLCAVVAGYEVGIRVGEFLGRSHYKIFHTTGTAGTFAAAAAAGHLLKLSSEQMLHALGSAGTQSAGLWEFLRDAADSKQLHTAHAATAGLAAAYLAKDDFAGAKRILTGAQGLAAGTSTDPDTARLSDGLGARWALMETSFKFHASCRHTHPAADAFQQLLERHRLRPDDVKSIVVHVHQGAIDVLGHVTDPTTVHQAKFSMGTVLALIGLHGGAGLEEFDSYFQDGAVARYRNQARTVFDPEVDREYPKRWIGKVTVETSDGRQLEHRVDEPKGDPGNTLTRSDLERKALRLANYRGGASASEMARLFSLLGSLKNLRSVPPVFVNSMPAEGFEPPTP